MNNATITAITQANPCVITCDNTIGANQNVIITGVLGMTQLNFNSSENNYYNIISSSLTSITINVDSTSFGAYISGGTVTPYFPVNQFSEIELHGFILDIQPSQVLV